MWATKNSFAKANSFAVRMQHYGLMYLLSYLFVAEAYAHAGLTLPSQANTKEDSKPFDAPPSEAASFHAPTSKSTTNYDGYSPEAVRTTMARRVHQWRGIWEDPAMTEARDSINVELRNDLEYLLYQDPLTRYALRLNMAAQADDPATNQTSTASSARSASSTASPAPESSAQAKTDDSATSPELLDKLKQLEDRLKEVEGDKKFSDDLGRQDCGFEPLSSASWRDSKVADTLKAELSAWEKRATGETFYQYIYKEYAPGLAPSQTHCNGRGSCGVVSCTFVDRELTKEKRQHMFYIMEMLARLSRVTEEENGIIMWTLNKVAAGSIDIVRTYTPMIQHDKARDAKKAYDAKRAKTGNYINLILGGLIPIFCCFVPGAGMIAAIAASSMLTAVVGAGTAQLSKSTVQSRGPGIIGNAIGASVNLIQGFAADAMRKETAMSAGDHPVQEIVVTLADYQGKMRENIEVMRGMILDRAEAMLNGTGLGAYNMHAMTENGAFLDTNLEKRDYLDKVKVEVEARVMATMINHAWRSNYVYIAMDDAPNGCENDRRSRKELRACLPELPKKVFYFHRMDDAWNDRKKDVVTSPNGWSKLPGQSLNITLPNIARASYAWWKVHGYDDFDKVNTPEMLNALESTGGPLYGTFNIPIGTGGEVISEIGDPVKMATVRENEEYHPPCIIGRSWKTKNSDDEDSVTYQFIKAVGLHTHPTWHHRCQKGRAHCKVDKKRVVKFDQSSNARYPLPWGMCDGKKGEHMRDNKHHWCKGNKGAVNLKLITHCEPGWKTTNRQSQFEEIPQK